MQTYFFDQPMKVRVYRNLNKAGPNYGCWSVRSMDPKQHYGKVILHATDVILTGTKCVISEKGRQRVIREQSKNVHAFLEGFIQAATVLDERYPISATKLPSNGPLCPSVEAEEVEITYNPYKYDSFVEKATEKPVGNGFTAHLNQNHTVSLVPFNLALVA